MKTIINLNDVDIGYRIPCETRRPDFLAESLDEEPITVMKKAEGRYLLLNGYPRLQEARERHTDTIEANVLSPVESELRLRLEIAHTDSATAAARVEYSEKLKAIRAERIKACKAAGANGKASPLNFFISGKARSAVARKAGFTSNTQMGRIRYILKHRPELLEQIEFGKKSVTAAYKEAKLSVKTAAEPAPAIVKPVNSAVQTDSVTPLEPYAPYRPDREDSKAFNQHIPECGFRRGKRFSSCAVAGV